MSGSAFWKVAGSVLLSLAMLGDTAQAETERSLLALDSLAGWEYGASPVRGWQVREGVLSGEAGATPLLGGWSLGDFRIRITWTGDSPVWAFRLLSCPTGEEQVFPVQAASKARAHETIVERKGTLLNVTTDGQSEQHTLDEEIRYAPGLSIEHGKLVVQQLRLSEPQGEPLFASEGLAGWWTPGDLAAWRVQDGVLALVGPNGNYLRSETEYGNFTLSFDVKIARGGNSGVGIRTPKDGWPSGDGMELQVMDVRGLDKHGMLSIYGNVEPLALAHRSEGWNHVVLRAEGYLISAWMNGQLVQHANTARHPELKHRHLKGWIGFQDHGDHVEFREVRLLEAPDGTGLTEWYDAPRETPAVAVLDRLLNPERLSRPQAIRTEVATAQTENEHEQTVAEFEGPGALVRAFSDHAQAGEYRLYFDGDEKPRVVGTLEQLQKKLPKLGDYHQPLLTYVPFQKRLRVTLQGAAERTESRFEIVRFDAGAELETFTKAKRALPRDFVGSLIYRHDQHGWGTHREADPLPRVHSDPQTVAPGSSRALVELSGAGMVHWTKLTIDHAALVSDDLMIEMYYDGETTPSLAAPARYLFTPFTHNYPNYLLVDRGGVTNSLAMPYAAGLRIAVVNRGKQPVSVGLTVSYEPADHDPPPGSESVDPAERWRLCGVFQPASDGKPFVEQAGKGRLVGLIGRLPSEHSAHFNELAVDAAPQAGWSGSSLASFYGLAPGEEDVRRSLSGQRGDLAWRHLVLAPIDFEQSLRLTLEEAGPGVDRLALFYLKR